MRSVPRLIIFGLALLFACPAASSAAPPTAPRPAFQLVAPHDEVVVPPTSKRPDALFLRFGLLGLLGLALAGGAFAQLRDRQRTRPTSNPHSHQEADAASPSTERSLTSTPRASSPYNHRPTSRTAMPTESSSSRWQVIDSTGTRPLTKSYPTSAQPAPTAPEAHCARAIAAAARYDRRTARAEFAAALDRDPAIKPSTLPGFWDMPVTGHADLARTYLALRRPHEARLVLTMAELLFGQHRELATLLHQAESADFRRQA